MRALNSWTPRLPAPLLPAPSLAWLALTAALGGLCGCTEVSSPAPVLPKAAALSAAPATAQGPSELVLLSWNVEWLAPAGQGMVPRSAQELQEMAQVIEDAHPDVVILQEVQSEQAARALLPKGQWELQVERRDNDQRVIIGVREGLSWRGHPDYTALAVGNPGLRAGVDVEVQTAQGPVRILGVHLKAGCQWDPLQGKEPCQVLGRQLQALEAWIDTQASAQTPLVVIGDFNRQMHEKDPFFVELNDGDPAGLSLRYGPEKSSACEAKRRQPIDRVLTTTQLRSSAQIPLAQPALSDHCPIVATVALK